MVTKEQFEATVRYLESNSDFFDPVHLGENFWATTKKMVEQDMVEYEVVESGLVSTHELYEIIHFLESYSDVDLMEPHGFKVPIENCISRWWEMYEDNSRDVIDEIVNDIDSGEAHLMTRNELAEFIQWLFVPVNSEQPSPSEKFMDELDRLIQHGDFHFDQQLANEIAKAYFVEKGYEA